MEDIRIERLEKLKNATIMRNLSELDTDNEFLLYDDLLRNTFSGDYNDIFESNYLDDSNRDEILSLVSKYNSLCFYRGEFENWVDSIEGVSLSDLDLVSMKLLDNYDYLIRLAKNGGEAVLKFLNRFSGSSLSERGAIIAVLRNSFYNDDVLEKVLIEMSREDGKYKDFTDKQKIILCDYPDGVLYKVEDNEAIEIPSEELKKSIIEGLMGTFNSEFKISDISAFQFEDVVGSIYASYFEENYSIFKK